MFEKSAWTRNILLYKAVHTLHSSFSILHLEWPPVDPRREELIARRPATADEVAKWARDMHDRRESIVSTKSTSSTYREIAANGVLALIAVARSLLGRQLDSLEKAFVEEGGFSERLFEVRAARRSQG